MRAADLSDGKDQTAAGIKTERDRLKLKVFKAHNRDWSQFICLKWPHIACKRRLPATNQYTHREAAGSTTDSLPCKQWRQLQCSSQQQWTLSGCRNVPVCWWHTKSCSKAARWRQILNVKFSQGALPGFVEASIRPSRRQDNVSPDVVQQSQKMSSGWDSSHCRSSTPMHKDTRQGSEAINRKYAANEGWEMRRAVTEEGSYKATKKMARYIFWNLLRLAC